MDISSATKLRTIQIDDEGVGASTVGISPDGTKLVTGYYGKARLWDFATGELLHTLTCTGWVCFVDFSPDSTKLLTAGYNDWNFCPIALWNTETGEQIHTYGEQQISFYYDAIYSVAFSPDGTKILAGVWNGGTAKLLDVDTGDGILTFSGHDCCIKKVCFSPDGSLALTSGGTLLSRGDDTVRIWDVTTGNEIQRITDHNSRLRNLSLSPNGKELFTNYPNAGRNRVCFWDIETGESLREFPLGLDDAHFSSDGSKIVATDVNASGNAVIFYASSSELLGRFGEEHSVKCVDLSPDNARLVIGERDYPPSGTIILYDTATKRELLVIKSIVKEFSNVRFSHDGSKILTFGDSYRSYFEMWDASNGELLLSIKLNNLGNSSQSPYSHPSSCALSPDDSQCLIAAGSEAILLDTSTGDTIQTYPDNNHNIDCVAFSPDGSKVLIGGEGCQLLDKETGSLLRSFVSQDQITALAFTPDGSKIVTGSEFTGIALLWDISDLVSPFSNVSNFKLLK